MFHTTTRLILASNSPRRERLLSSIGVIFDVIPPEADESTLDGETPDEHVKRLSELKAGKVANDNPDAFVIGFDTIVVIDGVPLGKPEDEAGAKEMLSLISGKTHRVLSGYCVMQPSSGLKRVGVKETRVTIKGLTPEEIDAYVKTGESTDKAGAYAIQGYGSFMVSRIDGSYTNVVGLPLSDVVDALVELGVLEVSGVLR